MSTKVGAGVSVSGLILLGLVGFIAYMIGKKR